MSSLPNDKHAISNNYPLTEFTASLTLENVPGSNTRHNIKQTNGGNVKNTQPPVRCGFFMPAISGDCTYLPGVVDYKIPSRGKVHSVSIWTLNGTRQFYSCPNIKQSNEVNAMQTANAPATTTPVVNGFMGITCPTSPQSNPGRCLIHSNTLLEALLRAKAKDRKEERGNGYHELLREFHRRILPAFILEAGSVHKASHLLGIHRETLTRYIDHAGIDMKQRAGGAA